MPKNWAFDQYNGYKFSGFDLDKDAVSGRDNGVSLNTKYKYNRYAVRKYMEQFLNNPNPDYYYYDGHDCANFTSQCVHAGGYPMNNVWYGDKRSLEILSTENDITVSDYLEMMGRQDEDSNIDGNIPLGDHITRNWSMANDQYYYFKNIQNGFTNVNPIEIPFDTTGVATANAINQAASEGRPIQVGDIISWHCPNNPNAYHSAIVSKVENNMIYYAQHSPSKIDNALINGMKSDFPEKGEVTVSIIRINDYRG